MNFESILSPQNEDLHRVAKTQRDAYFNASSDFDLEHVTPWIKRNSSSSGMSPYISKNERPYVSSKLNLTIDSHDELEMMRVVFSKVDKPLVESWYKMCRIAYQNRL